VVGDKRYDADWISQWCLQQNIESGIPARRNTQEDPIRLLTCDEEKYRDHNVFERCIGR
jgi:hypothetical protein